MAFLRFLLVGLALAALVPAVCAADDDLPNFNAPADNSPLNVDKVDRIMGVPMFKANSLWSEDDGIVARRLGWPQESLTKRQSSFRLYPAEGRPFTLFGLRAYSCVLYATKGYPTEVSIVFINRGDYEWPQRLLATARRQHPSADSDNPVPDGATNSSPASRDPTEFLRQLSPDDREEIARSVQGDFEKAFKQDTQKLTDALTGLLGDPQHMGFGGSDSDTRERVLRWDWQGHAFLLSSPKDAYLSLRIVPTAFADDAGKVADVDRDDIKAELAQRVKQLDNGDVVVTEIPMVDQGPKGYCVPATWERYLRYLGIPADMYVLANAANTSALGGTDLDVMVQNVDSLVTLYHRRIDSAQGDLDLKVIAKSIDAGLPLMWACYIHTPFDDALTQRMKERREAADWSAWAAKLADGDKMEIAKEITGTPVDGGHQRMIIGYNAKTNEIAISDSWSKAYQIRWMTLTEAKAIDAGQTFVIEP